MRRAGAALVAAVLAATPGGVRAVTADYTSFHVLGDSLSDVGNVYRASFGRIPRSPPYWEGRFSNGKVWADHVADSFRDEGLPTGNHAWGGAKARTDGDGIPDLALQVTRYRQISGSRRGDRPLVAMFAGGNDILDGAGSAGIRQVGRQAATAVGDAAASVRRSGGRDFLLFRLPDIGAIPKYGDNPEGRRSARQGSIAFNRELDRQVVALRDRGARVEVVDTFALFEALIADPRAFGVRNTTTPCLDSNDRPCTPLQGERRAFFDEIHPNFVVHTRIAEAALARIDAAGSSAVASAAVPRSSPAPAPVPLPASGALLLAGAAALAGLARLRRYQRSIRQPSSAPSPVTPAIARPYQVM